MNTVTFQLILRLVLGVMFLVSGITKVMSIDNFELYVFSLGLSSMNVSFTFARFTIIIELILAVHLLLGTYLRWVKYGTIGLLVVFTGFLCYQWVQGNEDNCFCFGELLAVSPGVSILKNLVFIALALVMNVNRPFSQWKKYTSWLSFITVPAFMFISSPPDYILEEEYRNSIALNESLFHQEILSNDTLFSQHNEPVMLYCLYSNGCKHCIRAHKIISSMVERSGLNKAQVRIVFWGNPTKTETFMANGNIHFPYAYIQANRFLRMTNGAMPIIVLTKDDRVIGVYNSRSIDESRIVQVMTEF